MTTLEYYQSLPPGTRLKFKTCEVIKMKYDRNRDIYEDDVLRVNDGSIHHISEFVILSVDPIGVLECASGKISSNYRVHIEYDTNESEEACKLRGMLEFHFGPHHQEILSLDTFIRFCEFRRKHVKPS